MITTANAVMRVSSPSGAHRQHNQGNGQQWKWDIERIARVGATLKYRHDPNMDKVVIMGLLDIQKTVLFYSFFKSYYSVLTEDGNLRYYRNRNDYYFDKYGDLYHYEGQEHCVELWGMIALLSPAKIAHRHFDSQTRKLEIRGFV